MVRSLDIRDKLSIKNKKGLIIKRIVFFDIDGCICENFFPNLNEKSNIQELKQKILNTPLNSDFVKYYVKISQNVRVKSYFITGRRAKDFENETLDQLKVLDVTPEQIIFFPDNYAHTKIRYNTFKIYHILSLAIQNKESEVIIYDDLDGYYPKLISLGLDLKIPKLSFKHVKNHKRFWVRKLNELKAKHSNY